MVFIQLVIVFFSAFLKHLHIWLTIKTKIHFVFYANTTQHLGQLAANFISTSFHRQKLINKNQRKQTFEIWSTPANTVDYRCAAEGEKE